MASDPRFPLLLLLLLGGGCSLGCNLTCSTDYQTSVNCSCSTLDPLPVLVQVSCSGEDMMVNGTCSVAPPLHWCRMQMDDLWLVASVGTRCTSVVVPSGAAVAAEESSWELADVVKPSAPFDVRVTETDDFFNVTWSVDGDQRLVYNVCLQDGDRPLEDGSRCWEGDQQSVLLDRRQLQSGFVVHVQAKMSPRHLGGPWSEWSGPAAWRPSGPSVERDGVGAAWWWVSLPVVLVLVLVLVAFLHRPRWQKKLELVTFVPKPNHFFEPLYKNYQGNFKDWVKSAFSEYDYIHVRPSAEDAAGKKRLDVLFWNDEDGSPRRPLQDEEAKRCCRSPRRPRQDDGGGARGAGPSIHTVTLSGEDEDGGTDRRGGAEASPRRGDGPEEDFPFPPPADEVDRASLDSFASVSRHSEDGYPHVDLDTFDSGFGECGSPGANRAERRSSGDHRPSNYVKQWTVGGEGGDDGRRETETLPDSGC